MRTLNDVMTEAGEEIRARESEIPDRYWPGHQPARGPKFMAALAGAAVVVLAIGAPALWLVTPNESGQPVGSSSSAGPLEEDPFLAGDPHAQEGWAEADEPGLASLYDGGPHVLHQWTDHWSILAGVYEGRLCVEYRSIHGGAAGCQGNESEPWAVPGVFDSLAGFDIKLEDGVWAPHGIGTVFGLTSIDVARIELTFESGATIDLTPYGRTDEIGFGGYGHSFAIEADGSLVTVSAYDAEDLALGAFDFSSEHCRVFDEEEGMGFEAGLDNGIDVSPREFSLLLNATPQGCGVGYGIHFPLP